MCRPSPCRARSHGLISRCRIADMTSEVDVSTVLDALSVKIGEMTVENEVLRLQVAQLTEINTALVEQVRTLRLTMSVVGLDENGQALVDGVNP